MESNIFNYELVRCLLGLACLSVRHFPMLKKCIYFNLLVYSYHVAMQTCMLHLSSVIVGFSFNHNILFYYAYVFPHISTHCICTHWNIYVFIRYIFHVFYLYFAWYNCFVLACLKHLHLKRESCVNVTLCHI